MAARSPGVPAVGEGALLCVLLVGGCMGGFVARAAQAWAVDGGAGASGELFGISPFEVLAAWLAAEALLRSAGGAAPALGWPSLVFAAVAALPSGLATWGATLAYGTWSAFLTNGEARRGSAIAAALSACALWWSVGERFLGETVMSLDSRVAASAIGLLADGVRRDGNAIFTPWGHETVVLAQCSTAYGLPIAVVAMVGLATRGGAPKRDVARWVVVLAVSYWSMNSARLSFLAWSDATYAVGHGSVGLGAFDAAATLLTLATAAAASHGRDGDAS
jgi:hypothetical protein